MPWARQSLQFTSASRERVIQFSGILSLRSPQGKLSGGIWLHGSGAKEKSVPKVKILEPTAY